MTEAEAFYYATLNDFVDLLKIHDEKEVMETVRHMQHQDKFIEEDQNNG